MSMEDMGLPHFTPKKEKSITLYCRTEKHEMCPVDSEWCDCKCHKAGVDCHISDEDCQNHHAKNNDCIGCMRKALHKEEEK